MATLTIVNLASEPTNIRELYYALKVGETITIDRASVDIPGMTGLIEAVAAKLVSLAVTYSPDELATGLMQPPWSVEAQDMARVNAADPAAGTFTIRVLFAAGLGGNPDDVTIYAANALPYKFRVLDAIAYVSTNVALMTLDVWTRPSGAGTHLASMSGATTGRNPNLLTASAVATPGTLEGLFVNRGDDGIAGEVLLTCRLEN